MPTYSFRNTETGEESEVVMKIAELAEFKESNPMLEVIITGGALCRSVNIGKGLLKGKNAGFAEVLKKIHQRTPGSCLDKTTNI